ncbi:cilia- and flagella-associated protein 53-like [Prorops nasuta]|uniref:cilia- and flagella-associated protein 53-like n=1 Tax=Prorops nasuta TaxID=863751 RepID=UPI0034CF9332
MMLKERNEESLESKLAAGRRDFERSNRRKARRLRINERVRKGLESCEEELRKRREKLRRLILDEEESLIREIVEKAQISDEIRMEENLKRNEHSREEQRKREMALVSAKRVQQYLNRCPEVRETRSRKLTIDAKHSNLAQIAGNEARRQSDRELDSFWHELMLREVEAKKNREAEEARLRAEQERSNVSTLKSQISGKLSLEGERRAVQEEEKKNLEELWERMRQEARAKRERERLKRRKLRMELEEQIIRAQKELLERAEREKEADRMLNERLTEELREERRKELEAAAELRERVLAYLVYLEQFKEQEAKRELEFDKMIQQSMKDANVRRELATKKYNEGKARLFQDVLQGREQQVKMKEEAVSRERELKRDETIALEKEMEKEASLRAQRERENRERKNVYQVTLKEQQKETDLRKQREREEEKALSEKMKRQEEELEKLAKELLSASEDVSPHPFKVALQRCAERMSSEKSYQNMNWTEKKNKLSLQEPSG